VANDDIHLTLYEGEIHALVGENGAGKTTLMKILYGEYRADKGEILVRGNPVRITNPSVAVGTWHRYGAPALYAGAGF